MRNSLRSRLMIVGVMLLPVLAATYWEWQRARAEHALVPLVLAGIVLIERIVLLYTRRLGPRP